MKTIAKENNGGGISFEQYDDNMNIISVVTGLEFAQNNKGTKDITTYGEEWDWSDVGGNITGYNADGENTDGSEYDASDMIDNSEYTKTIAEWDGEDLILHVDAMGGNGKSYFGVSND